MKAFVAACLGLGVVGFGIAGKAKSPERPGLSLRQEPDRVVMQWTGPVAPPMRERFEAAFRQLEDDPRRIVISLNSPGGFVEHGHQVIKEIRIASRTRQVDTMVEAGKSCASMCVPIYLVGTERLAHPKARFMFHEASIQLKPEAERALRDLKYTGSQIDVARIRKTVVDRVTNDLFDEDMGPRSVDARWLEQMRKKIRGRDVWLTAAQLMQQGSGVVDRLY